MLSDDLDARLRLEARRRGVPLAEVVREAERVAEVVRESQRRRRH
jgi:hypothetical protein